MLMVRSRHRFRGGDSSRVAALIRESHDDVGSSSLQLSAVPCPAMLRR